MPASEIVADVNKQGLQSVGAREGWRDALDRPRRMWRDVREMLCLPNYGIDLMDDRTADNDPFYADLVRSFYSHAVSRHPKLPLIGRFTHVAVCELPQSFDQYFRSIEAAARRNYKKAQRSGYRFATINYNDHLEAIRRIRRSTDYRQGKVCAKLLHGDVTPIANPRSLLPWHDYFYAGTLRDGQLDAYAGCFVAGEACMLERILGDARHHADGIVPMLIVSLVKHLREQYPQVKYFVYGTYFGAREPMRRFKRKFLFLPHRVHWKLSGYRTANPVTMAKSEPTPRS